MKVGTDGTLLGAWASLRSAGTILDIGTGTGLIAIMAAQRSPEARITAIDIDADCITQARENVAASPWSDRIEVVHSSLQDFEPAIRFERIISNPPYFVDSLRSPDAARSTARHTDTLPFAELSQGVSRLLSPTGRFALILPPPEIAHGPFRPHPPASRNGSLPLGSSRSTLHRKGVRGLDHPDERRKTHNGRAQPHAPDADSHARATHHRRWLAAGLHRRISPPDARFLPEILIFTRK